MTGQDIADALNARLALFPGGAEVAWEGISYEPRIGVPYLITKLSSYLKTGVGAGINGAADHSGTWTVTVRRPAIEGRQPAGQVAGQLVDFFGRGAVLKGPKGENIILLQTSDGPALYFGDWVSVPVTVTFVAST